MQISNSNTLLSAAALSSRIVEAMPGGIAYLDTEHLFRFCNELQASYFGMTRYQMAGLGLYDVVPNNPEFSEAIERVLKDGEAFPPTAICVTWSGRSAEGEHNFIVSCTPDRDETGDIQGALLTAFEVSATVSHALTLDLSDGDNSRESLERIIQALQGQVFAVEQKLKVATNDLDSEERFRSIIELSSDAIVISNAARRITVVNAAACRMFGYEAEDLVGRMVEELVPVDSRVVFAGQFDPRLELGARSAGQLRGLRKDGTDFPAEASLTPFRISQREMVAAAITDVTVKRLEEEVRQSITDLQRSNAALEQFAYVASHDLQEPLRMVSNYTRLLGRRYKDKLDEDANTFIDFAVEGANRMQQLINDLLEFSRVGNSGKTLTTVAMQTAAKRALFSLSGAIEESGVEVTIEALPEVNGDETELTQLLQNLIANAIKFRRPKHAAIQVSAEQHGEDWTFRVSDNGLGFDEVYKDRIFVIFQRLHTRTEYPGTGIGLAVCKRIVEHHGGTIWAESVPGAGSSFYFTVQAATPPVESAGLAASDASRERDRS